MVIVSSFSTSGEAHLQRVAEVGDKACGCA